MDLEAIQAALREADTGGWLFYDFHHRDPMAYTILGLDMSGMTTRRWFYYVPANGEPVKLAHRVEPTKLDSLPGRTLHYSAWKELHEKLQEVLGEPATIAMQYSPMNNIPYVSVVDAGTVELVRSFGHEVTTSANLVQAFESVSGDDGFRSHAWAGDRVQKIKDEAFALMDDNLRHGRKITELEIKEHILARFEDEGMTSDGESPIVGFNDHPADPHFEPTAENAYTLHHGDTILVDLWARRKDPPGIYYDITWCGFAGKEPPSLYTEIFGVVCKARDAAVEFVREKIGGGTPCHGWEVDDACRRVVDQAGFGQHFVHRTGHSIGLQVHGNGVNIDNLETKDERLLVPGICFSIEPGIYLQGQMAVRTEVDVFITPSGSVEIVGPVQEALLFVG
jgi:Xaa-Pro aminopeptidase